MIRVELPFHLRTLAKVSDAVELEINASPATVNVVIDTLEARFPALRGTIRDPYTEKRRPLLRVFACGEDISHEPLDKPLPPAIVAGTEPLMIIGAIAGG